MGLSVRGLVVIAVIVGLSVARGLKGFLVAGVMLVTGVITVVIHNVLAGHGRLR